MSDAARVWRWFSFYAWKVWNRTRYYWPQAQSRKRAVEKLRRDARAMDFDYVVNVPWWWPFGGTGRFVDLRKDAE